MHKLIALAGLCALIVALAVPASGAAGTAPTIEHVHLTTDPYQTNVCGLDLVAVDTVVVTVLTSPSGATVNPRLLTTIFTNPSTGKSITLMEAGLAEASATIDNGDGTSSVVVTTDGLTKLSVPNGPPLNINVVGSVTFEVTFDTATGQFISFQFLSIKGPGPNPPGCDLITAALT